MTGRNEFTLFETLPAGLQPWMSVRSLCLVLTLIVVLLFSPEVLQRWRAMKLAEKVITHGGEIRINNRLLPQVDWWTVSPQANAFWGNIYGVCMCSPECIQVDDDFLLEISNLQSIHNLRLGNTDNPTVVTDQGTNILKQQNLEHLGITGGFITDSGFKELAKMKSLRTLGLHDLAITGEYLPQDAFPNLLMLDLSDTNFTNQGLKNLSSNSSLIFLHLSNTNVSSAGLQEISKFPNLRSLRLRNLKIDAEEFANLAILKKFYDLSLQGTAVDDAVAMQLSQLKQITKLRLYQSQITDQGIGYLARMKELETLFLPGSKITDAGLNATNQLTKLDYLDLSNTQITDAGLQQLSKLPALRMLNLSNTSVTDQAKQVFIQFPNLEYIDISNTKISSDTIEDLHDTGIRVTEFDSEITSL